MSIVHPPWKGGIEGGSLDEGFITNGFHLPYNPDNVAKAKVLRAEMTKAEKALWYNFLRELQISQDPFLSPGSPPTSPFQGEQSQFGIPPLSPLAKGGVNFQGEYQFHRLKVLRQQPIDNYIVDFYIASVKLVIEIDGDSHYTDEAIAYDHQRTRDLEQYGLYVMRFTNTDVYTNFE